MAAMSPSSPRFRTHIATFSTKTQAKSRGRGEAGGSQGDIVLQQFLDVVSAANGVRAGKLQGNEALREGMPSTPHPLTPSPPQFRFGSDRAALLLATRNFGEEGERGGNFPLFAEISRAYQSFARQKRKRNRGGEGAGGEA